MRSVIERWVAVAVLLLCGAVRAEVMGNMQSQTLSAEAVALMHSGKVNEALALHRRAIAADPAASAPVSSLANFYLWVADRVAPAEQARYRALADSHANQALELDDGDPVAHEVLRALDEDGASVLHQPAEAAHRLLVEGEVLFQQARYDAALVKFDAALVKFDAAFAADPKYSTAQVLAGDCFYARARWAEAEARFRRAAEVEPLNAQAWRFLADALAQQGKLDESRRALVASIAAHPGQQPSWRKWSDLMAARGITLQPLRLRIKSQFRQGADGKPTVVLAESFLKGNDAYGTAFWVTYGAGKASAQPNTTPFETELAAWRLAFRAMDELDGAATPGTLEAPVAQLRKLHKEGQLEAALFVLAYKERYRADFEAWKRRQPAALAAFLDKYPLRP